MDPEDVLRRLLNAEDAPPEGEKRRRATTPSRIEVPSVFYWPRWARVIVAVLGLILSVLGLADLPSHLRSWWTFLGTGQARTLIFGLGVLLTASALIARNSGATTDKEDAVGGTAVQTHVVPPVPTRGQSPSSPRLQTEYEKLADEAEVISGQIADGGNDSNLHQLASPLIEKLRTTDDFTRILAKRWDVIQQEAAKGGNPLAQFGVEDRRDTMDYRSLVDIAYFRCVRSWVDDLRALK